MVAVDSVIVFVHVLISVVFEVRFVVTVFSIVSNAATKRAVAVFDIVMFLYHPFKSLLNQSFFLTYLSRIRSWQGWLRWWICD